MGEKPVELDFSDSDVISFSCHNKLGTKFYVFEWGLSSLKIISNTKPSPIQYIMNMPFIFLSTYLENIDKDEDPIKLSYCGNDYVFTKVDNNPNCVAV